jgi:hypothetical protein
MAIALLGTTLFGFAPSVAAPDQPIASLSAAKYAGAFVTWGDRGRETNLRKWEDGLNQPRSSALGVDFYAHDKWSDFADYRWVPQLWQRLNPARNLVWSFPLTVKGTPLADVANGLHDREFKLAAQAIAGTQPQAIIHRHAVVRQGARAGLHPRLSPCRRDIPTPFPALQV